MAAVVSVGDLVSFSPPASAQVITGIVTAVIGQAAVVSSGGVSYSAPIASMTDYSESSVPAAGLTATEQQPGGYFPSWGTKAMVGAFFSDSGMGVANFNGGTALWESWTGVTVPVTRFYLAQSDYTAFYTDMEDMIQGGVKICLTIRPAYNPVSSADLANLTTLLQTMQNAGAIADITLWHEPYYSGLTNTQYVDMVEYYGPTVREYYPLVCVFSGPDAVESNGFYPGDSWCDKIAVDQYAYTVNYGDNSITNGAAIANAADPPKPLGIWEFNGSTLPLNEAGQTQAQVTEYFEYVQNYMVTRLQQGLDNADVLLFNSGSTDIVTCITSSSDYRLALWQNIYYALNDTIG
jgi:hypothetical protein